LGLLAVVGFQARRFDHRRPAPDRVNLRYGPHERNVLDFWSAASAASRRDSAEKGATEAHSGQSRTPLVVFFHGGGFKMGDKRSVPPWLVTRCLASGISVASVNYRLSHQAPFPAPMRDGARAIQFLRLKADELGIDPNRIAAAGGSAGAGIALWLGYHDDLAKPDSPDPMARQSTRLACMGVVGAQSSYDLRFIKREIGGRAHEHIALRPFFGIKTDADLESPQVLRLFEESSPINYVSADDPPAILFYSEPNRPLPANARRGAGIHHPRFGEVLKERLDPLGVPCILRHGDQYRDRDHPEEAMYTDLVAFFADQLHPLADATRRPAPAVAGEFRVAEPAVESSRREGNKASAG
jgi:acetyl esterase/lipase